MCVVCVCVAHLFVDSLGVSISSVPSLPLPNSELEARETTIEKYEDEELLTDQVQRFKKGGRRVSMVSCKASHVA